MVRLDGGIQNAKDLTEVRGDDSGVDQVNRLVEVVTELAQLTDRSQINRRHAIGRKRS